MRAEYVDHMGDDLSVVNAARVSFDNVSVADRYYDYDVTDLVLCSIPDVSEKDKTLINYLARGMPKSEWEKNISNIFTSPYKNDIEVLVNKLINMATHWAPFSHPHITLRMQAPVSVRTQCFKHKIGFSESEESRRYINSKPEIYVPDMWRKVASNVKQGSSDEEWFPENNGYTPKDFMEDGVDYYINLIKSGLAPEQARFVLPQGVEVNWIWTGSLASFARYYKQRIDPHAQKESQILAAEVGAIIEPLFPVSWRALTS
ncbi:MAG: thymidylate synthase (FAD) [Hyphomicrobiales bacterium]|nr:MAG: thymidylate synthase (FAD) [Hyphomicrobiales bacterium]